VALAILSEMAPRRHDWAIAAGDKATLTRAQGGASAAIGC